MSTDGMTVEFGILNQYTKVPANTRISRNVREIIVHPGWNYIDYDIAMLLLSEPIEFTDNVRPACLATKMNEGEEYPGECWIAGWGRTETGKSIRGGRT